VLNAAALYWAVRGLVSGADRTKMLVLWFAFLSMLNAISNAQSNALMAGLMIGAWNAQERKNPAVASFLVVLSVFVKLFGVFALIPCLLSGGRRRLLAYAAGWGVVMAALPLVAVRPAELVALYQGWYATVRAFSEARLGLSVMGFLRAWLHLEIPQNYVVLAGAIIMTGVALRGAMREVRFRLLVMASVLIFVTIFNYAAESPTFVLAVTGCALWYFFQARTTAADSRISVHVCLIHGPGSARATARIPGNIRDQGDPVHSRVDQTAIRSAAIRSKQRVILKVTHATGSRRGRRPPDRFAPDGADFRHGGRVQRPF
jgi:hypothetical protein